MFSYEPLPILLTDSLAKSDVWDFSFRSVNNRTIFTESLSLVILIFILFVVFFAAKFLVYSSRKNKETEPVDSEKEKKDKGERVIYQGAVKAVMDGMHPEAESLIPDLPKDKGKI